MSLLGPGGSLLSLWNPIFFRHCLGPFLFFLVLLFFLALETKSKSKHVTRLKRFANGDKNKDAGRTEICNYNCNHNAANWIQPTANQTHSNLIPGLLIGLAQHNTNDPLRPGLHCNVARWEKTTNQTKWEPEPDPHLRQSLKTVFREASKGGRKEHCNLEMRTLRKD